MKILALDCAGSACSVALFEGDAPRWARSRRMERGHGIAVAPMIDEAITITGWPPSSLDAVAVTTGPGSFTGLRIGLAAAKGLALVADRPLVGVSCFEAVANRALACRAFDAKTWDIAVLALESRRAEIFAEVISANGAILLPPCTALPAEILNTISLLIEERTAARRNTVAFHGEAAGKFLDLGHPNVHPETIDQDPLDLAAVAQLAQARLGGTNRTRSYTPGQALDYFREPDTGQSSP